MGEAARRQRLRGRRLAVAAPEKAGKPDKTENARGAGRQPGAKGHWRSQPTVTSAEVARAPMACAACRAALGPGLKRRWAPASAAIWSGTCAASSSASTTAPTRTPSSG